MWIKIFALNIFCEKYLQSSLCLMLHNMLKIITVRDVPVDNYEFLNIQVSSFIVWVHPSAPKP